MKGLLGKKLGRISRSWYDNQISSCSISGAKYSRMMERSSSKGLTRTIGEYGVREESVEGLRTKMGRQCFLAVAGFSRYVSS